MSWLSRLFSKKATRRAAAIRYSTGEIARIGDRVIDNGQAAIVQEIVIGDPCQAPKLVDGKIMFDTVSATGLMLMDDIGLPVFRPVTSKRWADLKFVAHHTGA